MIKAFYGTFFFWVNLRRLRAPGVRGVAHHREARRAARAVRDADRSCSARTRRSPRSAASRSSAPRRSRRTAPSTRSRTRCARRCSCRPTRAVKYKAKAAIDTFVVRAGDTLSAVVVWSASTCSGSARAGSRPSTCALVGVWLAIALGIAHHYRKLSRDGDTRRRAGGRVMRGRARAAVLAAARGACRAAESRRTSSPSRRPASRPAPQPAPRRAATPTAADVAGAPLPGDESGRTDEPEPATRWPPRRRAPRCSCRSSSVERRRCSGPRRVWADDRYHLEEPVLPHVLQRGPDDRPVPDRHLRDRLRRQRGRAVRRPRHVRRARACSRSQATTGSGDRRHAIARASSASLDSGDAGSAALELGVDAQLRSPARRSVLRHRQRQPRPHAAPTPIDPRTAIRPRSQTYYRYQEARVAAVARRAASSTTSTCSRPARSPISGSRASTSGHADRRGLRSRRARRLRQRRPPRLRRARAALGHAAAASASGSRTTSTRRARSPPRSPGRVDRLDGGADFWRYGRRAPAATGGIATGRACSSLRLRGEGVTGSLDAGAVHRAADARRRRRSCAATTSSGSATASRRSARSSTSGTLAHSLDAYAVRRRRPRVPVARRPHASRDLRVGLRRRARGPQRRRGFLFEGSARVVDRRRPVRQRCRSTPCSTRGRGGDEGVAGRSLAVALAAARAALGSFPAVRFANAPVVGAVERSPRRREATRRPRFYLPELYFFDGTDPAPRSLRALELPRPAARARRQRARRGAGLDVVHEPDRRARADARRDPPRPAHRREPRAAQAVDGAQHEGRRRLDRLHHHGRDAASST